MQRVFELQEKLATLALPSGFEHRVREEIKARAIGLCDEVYTDRLGNLICRKKGPGKKLMVCAHMDVIGFMATYIDEQGFVRLSPVGYHTPAALINARILFESGARGVIRPDHEALRAATAGEVRIHRLFCDIGAYNREEALSLVRIGDVAALESRTLLTEGGRIMTGYADNLAGCIAMLRALEQAPASQNDLYFVFTVQEEIGLKGARTAAYAIAPDACIAVDVCDTRDSLEQPENRRNAVRMGGGPAIKIKDVAMISDRLMLAHVKRAAGESPYQLEITPFGTTDGAAVQRVHGGVPTAAISIPTRNIHSGAEVYDARDLLAAAELIQKACALELNGEF